MDAIFLPEPATVDIDEDARGGVVTGSSTVQIEADLATVPGQYLRDCLTTCFAGAPVASASGATIVYLAAPDMADEQVGVTANEDQITIAANSLSGFWRGTHLVIQLLGPELVVGLPVALSQLPFIPITIDDQPSHSTRSMTLPLLDMAHAVEDALTIVRQLAAIGVNHLALAQFEPDTPAQMVLPHTITAEDYARFYLQAANLGITVEPDPEHIISLPSDLCTHDTYTREQIEAALWPDAVAALTAGWIGQRANTQRPSDISQTELTWDNKQRIAAYSLFWSALGVTFVDGPSFVWPWHLIRLQPQLLPDGQQTRVALLLAPGTHIHGDHIEMQRGKEGVMGPGLSITAMVNSRPVPITLVSGHPNAASGGTGVYQVIIPSLPNNADLRLAAIAQTNDGCSC
ncbi:hypothetical protein [Stomatohabitans albus]|uniref:hypothetical protein n=1 Tax=Stomatohabitans albus TaxID=3110766 RepID=UPI00300C11CE